jgi:hypothetical protein
VENATVYFWPMGRIGHTTKGQERRFLRKDLPRRTEHTRAFLDSYGKASGDAALITAAQARTTHGVERGLQVLIRALRSICVAELIAAGAQESWSTVAWRNPHHASAAPLALRIQTLIFAPDDVAAYCTEDPSRADALFLLYETHLIMTRACGLTDLTPIRAYGGYTWHLLPDDFILCSSSLCFGSNAMDTAPYLSRHTASAIRQLHDIDQWPLWIPVSRGTLDHRNNVPRYLYFLHDAAHRLIMSRASRTVRSIGAQTHDIQTHLRTHGWTVATTADGIAIGAPLELNFLIYYAGPPVVRPYGTFPIDWHKPAESATQDDMLVALALSHIHALMGSPTHVDFTVRRRAYDYAAWGLMADTQQRARYRSALDQGYALLAGA